MTMTPGDPGAAPGRAPGDDDAAEEDVDVLYLAGQRPPAEGAWLRVTAAEARSGGEFTALFLSRARPCANGGDVLLHVAPGTGRPGDALPAIRMRVMAVAAGSVIPVAAWDHLQLEEWPEIARPAVAFARGALRELRQHGADVLPSGLAEVEPAAAVAVAGFPALPASARPAAGW